mgnify:CR=1 FL=1
MSRFLSVIPLDKARRIIRQIAQLLPDETVPLAEAYGRILATEITSDMDIPGFDRSTVDGYAVRASETTGAGEALPSILGFQGEVQMGGIPDEPVRPGSAVYIPTGAFLPSGADAVVMIEYSELMGDQVLIHRPVAPGENVISRGEDFSAGRQAVPSGTLITARAAGVLAACGAWQVRVRRKPRVSIISTGNELVPVDTRPEGGQIRDVNTYLCAGFVRQMGGEPIISGIIPDERDALSQALTTAVAASDVVLISGGSSKGERDMCADIIAAQGEVIVHGVAVSPGKPTIIGRADGRVVVGLPGHPASAFIILITLVRDLLQAITGDTTPFPSIRLPLSEPVASARGREEYVRVRIQGGQAVPVHGRSGLTNTLIQSDGVLRIPAETEGYEAGDVGEVLVWR